jgi:hypothetical protein
MGLWPIQGERVGSANTLYRTSPFPLSSRAKPRDLQFRRPFLETPTLILKQNCHLAYPRVPRDRSVAERSAVLSSRRISFVLPVGNLPHWKERSGSAAAVHFAVA